MDKNYIDIAIDYFLNDEMMNDKEYIDIAIEHFEGRIKCLNCQIWEEQLLDKLKLLKQQGGV